MLISLFDVVALEHRWQERSSATSIAGVVLQMGGISQSRSLDHVESVEVVVAGSLLARQMVPAVR